MNSISQLSSEKVGVVAQSLTNEQKTQARQNIDATTLVVTFDFDTSTCDTSIAEIISAHESGRTVICCIDNNSDVYAPAFLTLRFAAYMDDGVGGVVFDGNRTQFVDRAVSITGTAEEDGDYWGCEHIVLAKEANVTETVYVTINDNGDGTGTSSRSYSFIKSDIDNGCTVIAAVYSTNGLCFQGVMAYDSDSAINAYGIDYDGMYWGVSITDNAVLVDNLSIIPEVPTTLPNPEILTIGGKFYNGLLPVTVDLPEALYVNVTMNEDGTNTMNHASSDLNTAKNNGSVIICKLFDASSSYLGSCILSTHAIFYKGEIVCADTLYQINIVISGDTVNVVKRSLTPDWNASEGKAGHILNRTHYSHWVEALPETTITLNDVYYLPLCGVDLEIGNNYILKLNGTAYECTAFEYVSEGIGYPVIGNPSWLEETLEDNGIPFIFTQDEPGTQIYGYDSECADTAVIGLSAFVYEKISEKYLPERHYTVTISEIPEWDISTGDDVWQTTMSMDTTDLVRAIENGYPIYIRHNNSTGNTSIKSWTRATVLSADVMDKLNVVLFGVERSVLSEYSRYINIVISYKAS